MYNYFHGFVTQELRHDERVKNTLLEFYQTCNGIRRGYPKGKCLVFLKERKIRRHCFYAYCTVVFHY